MKIHRYAQHSAEWYAARLGKPTASNFAKIVTRTGKGSYSAARETYKMQLVAEWLTGKPADNYVSAAMQRGTDLEPRARAWYALETGRKVEEVGFIESDCGRWGCSPDGLVNVGEALLKHGLEIKCLLNEQHVRALIDGEPPAEYAVQVQAALWITGLPVWDFVLWTDEPRLPCSIWPVEPDKNMFAAFETELPLFCAEVEAAFNTVAALRGPVDEPEEISDGELFGYAEEGKT